MKNGMPGAINGENRAAVIETAIGGRAVESVANQQQAAMGICAQSVRHCIQPYDHSNLTATLCHEGFDVAAAMKETESY